jgi:hypothetical protein
LAVFLYIGAQFASTNAVGSETSFTNAVLDDDTITYGEAASGTVTVRSDGSNSDGNYGPNPSGTVSVYVCHDASAFPACDSLSGNALPSVQLNPGVNASASASFEFTPAAAGFYTILFVYDGDDTYDSSFDTSTLTVAKAPLTVTASDKTVTYGGNAPVYTYSIDSDDLVNGDSDAGVSGVTCDSSYTSTTGVASSPLAISCSGGTAANYEIDYVDGDLTIEKANITITAENVNVDYGDAEPASYTFTATGLVNSDDESVLDTPPTCALTSDYKTIDDVDTVYDIDCSGGSDGNYNITSYVAGKFNVDPAPLNVTAGSFTIIYGDSAPAYTFLVTGWKNSEDDTTATDYVAPTCDAASILATSAITCSGGSAKNYTFDYTPGTLTVNPYALAPVETWYTGQTFYYTKSSSETAVQVTLTASITASFTCAENGPTVADGRVTFKDKLTGKIFARNVAIAEVNGDCNEGIATAFATLSTGSDYATTYIIVVEATGSLVGSNQGVDEGYQLNADPGSATVVVSTPQPAGTGIFGYGELGFIANTTTTALGTEGTLTSGMSGTDSVTFSISLTYGTGKRAATPKGQITLIIPGANGSFYYVKSNSITSVTASGGNTATIYAKANITQYNADNTSVSIEGGASLRVDVTETGTLAGFTLQSSKTSALFYSSNWVKTGKAWATVQQLIAGTGASITVN